MPSFPHQVAKPFLNVFSTVTPTISLDGLDTTHDVIQNRTVTLDCPAEGAPRPTILWFYKGIPLDNEFATGLTISEDGKTLRIASAQLSDAGDYVCIATNEAGDAQLDHILNVLGKFLYMIIWRSPGHYYHG